ncbi:hypothetical protein [Zobellia nedashkovskayae]|uniref:hypothetical protein n=1 Tax=Zobellia nedashkovskayae TaxID=2779510 RepID=UPI00188BE95F|nr:hypothetical protein [Zobellia nedashkovskayae]
MRGNSTIFDNAPAGSNWWLFIHIVLPIWGIFILFLTYNHFFPDKSIKAIEQSDKELKEKWAREKEVRSKKCKSLSLRSNKIISKRTDIRFQSKNINLQQVKFIPFDHTEDYCRTKDISKNPEIEHSIFIFNIISNYNSQDTARSAIWSVRKSILIVEEEIADMIYSKIDLDTGPVYIAGKICIEESFTPYIKNQYGEPLGQAMHPDTKEVLSFHDDNIYHNYYFSSDLAQTDSFLEDSIKDSPHL